MALSEHLEKLRHFKKLVSYPSIREGAAAMGISQAGLSKSISALEDVLETQLFLRSREGLLLTKEGQEVLKASERILSEASDLELKLRSLKVLSTPKQLRIGMYDSIAVYFFPELSIYIKTLYPSVAVELTVDTSANLSKKIESSTLDLVIGVNLHRKKTQAVEFFKLFDDHYAFYKASKIDANPSELSLLIHPAAEDSEGKKIEDYLSHVINKREIHRVYNFETLKVLVTQGLGIGVLPTQVAKPLVSKDQLSTVQIPQAKHLFGQHTIGFLATKELMKNFGGFAEDIYRVGKRWSKG